MASGANKSPKLGTTSSSDPHNLNNQSPTGDLELEHMYEVRDPLYKHCPFNDDWEKLESICKTLEAFDACTNIISGSEYPTSNLYFGEVQYIKKFLDRQFNDEREWLGKMVKKMKEKFDKYWNESSMLMCIGSILDPRCKFTMLELCFKDLYDANEILKKTLELKKILREIHAEYASLLRVRPASLMIDSTSSSHGGETEQQQLPVLSSVFVFCDVGMYFHVCKSLVLQFVRLEHKEILGRGDFESLIYYYFWTMGLEVQQLQDGCDVQATNIILRGLPPDVYALVNHQEAAKDIWDRVKLLMKGTELSYQERECRLYNLFDKFAYVQGETLYEYYWRFSQLINDMHTIGMTMQQVQVNTKFLNALLPE
ncbi:zinc finger BED domain-containing protein RICESLEEPER 2-like protein [Tanacetum coccineum]